MRPEAAEGEVVIRLARDVEAVGVFEDRFVVAKDPSDFRPIHAAEYVFALHNADDRPRRHAIRSLSVGDVIEVTGGWSKTWHILRVDSCGFATVTEDSWESATKQTESEMRERQNLIGLTGARVAEMFNDDAALEYDNESGE